jgi:putative DNA primase/helicase
LGDGNCASPTFASLATPFGLWSLLGKSLATISDARLGHRTEVATVIERLLRITGEDDVEIERKFLEPLCCKLPTRISIVSNELPRLPDVSGAIVSRMLVLRLTETFLGKEDTKLTERLLAERPGILLWAIAGWCRLRAVGSFRQPDTAFELLGDLKDLSSPISEFVRDCCDEGPEHSVQRSELFEAYTEWCKKKGPSTRRG